MSMRKSSSLVELLQFRAIQQAEQCAYAFWNEDGSEVRVTYAELDGRVRSVAAALQQKGQAGERALLLFPPGLETGKFPGVSLGRC